MGCWVFKGHPADRAIDILQRQEEIPYDIIDHLSEEKVRSRIQSWRIRQNGLGRKVSITYSRHYMAPLLELQGICPKGFVKEVYQIWPVCKFETSH